MIPLPRGQNPQHQPLTVALRRICQDYPAGAGVLRELLQNADDAGASTVKLVLDTTTYPKKAELAEGISEYHGPALLAYNDALFLKSDFRSLASLGDSKKVRDKTATGKFGLGFSSVFNWTDCPSILSGSTLLLLDPLHSWSSKFNPPGGPEYDFPACAKHDAMQNQLQCFSKINTSWHGPFEGTIIRVPLRNASQAKADGISSKETSVDDIRNTMTSFADEMGSNGLLFLKSVRKIILSIDDQLLDEVELLDAPDLIGSKQNLKDTLDSVINRGDLSEGEIYHETRLRHWSAKGENVKTYGILNLVKASTLDASLDELATSEKLFPWVAVAAQIVNSGCEKNHGRLYSVLPLPILTGMPVHIHGIFSISADRSRLHGLDDRGVQDTRLESWNKFLFSKMIPVAWAKLLLRVCENHEVQEFFHIWPTPIADARDWCSGMSRAVIDVVSQKDYPVWYAETGYVPLSEGILARQSTDAKQKLAFREAGMWVIYLTEQLYEEASRTPQSRILCPKIVYEYLQANHGSRRLSNSSRLVVLDYLQTQISLTDVGALEIFPFEDGSFRSLLAPPAFLHRDESEQKLFELQPEKNLDGGQLSQAALAWLREQVKSNPMVRYRSAEDLCDYFLEKIANGSSDILIFGNKERLMLDRVWNWIISNCPRDKLLSSLGSLWLIPLHGSGVRKLVPTNAFIFATWFEKGKGRELALELLPNKPTECPYLVADDALTDDNLQYMLSLARRECSLHLKNGSKFEDLVDFLESGRALLQNASENVKFLAFQTLKELYLAPSDVNRVVDIDKLKSLCMFKEVQWPKRSSAMIRSTTGLKSKANLVGLKKLVPVPVSTNQIFLDATDESASRFFEKSGLMACLNEIQILENVVIPALKNGGYDYMACDLRLKVAELVFQNYYKLSSSAKEALPKIPAVPLETGEGDEKPRFACPLDIIDPAEISLTDLYFDNELIRPDKVFYQKYSGVLLNSGMNNKLNERLILDRIRVYEAKEAPFSIIESKAQKLLSLPINKVSTRQEDFASVVQSTIWLPGHSSEKPHALTSSLECRDSSEKAVVGHVWYTLPFRVERSWRSIFGWQKPLKVDLLISQLSKSIATSDARSVEQTLVYLEERHKVDNYIEQLLSLNFVRSSNGLFVSPSQASQNGAETLMPYLYNVDLQFWENHTEMLDSAKIPQTPDAGRLYSVQEKLLLKQPLTGADIDVAVEVAHMWVSQPFTSFGHLKAPDETGMLLDVENLVFNDLPLMEDLNCAMAHQTLSRSIANRLNMQPVSELLKNGELGISDVDEDEFTQREEVTDGIRDTLDRYTRSSTFHEYIANADDCSSASAINFLFDGNSYGTEHLLTTDMSSLQGPALLIHNDGVFTDSDFEGLKHVGRGSKRDDPKTIGKFGRGSQTMYHWTDVPMILSGPYMLILDPLQQHLPFNYRTQQKKPGVKIIYTKLKAKCSDQLAPFEGLWGFNSNIDSYAGTIFRFPLRSKGTSSDLLESLHCPDSFATIELFRGLLDEARLTLLFLRNIGCVDFGIRQQANVEWRVSRGNWPENGTFSDWANIIVECFKSQCDVVRVTERWWRAVADVDDAPADLQHRHKRRMKYVECGIAAQISTDGEAKRDLSVLKSKFFNCIPLKFESALPIQVHATFLLSGDRQNIAIEETSKDAGSEWNKWLLRERIPQIYLQFLEDLGRKISYKVYDYFPVDIQRGEQSLSELVRTAFWEQVRFSDRRIFPIVEPVRIERTVKISQRPQYRQAPEMVDVGRAVFDLLNKQKSDAFQLLLSNCVKNMVRPPVRMNRYLRDVPQFNFISPSFVRKVIQSEASIPFVKESWQRDRGFLSNLLSFIMPNDEKDYVELNDCKILPSMDRNLETLTSRDGKSEFATSEMYFSASAECRSLFTFAASKFSQDDANEEFMTRIVDSERFNVKKFERGDVPAVLKYKKNWGVDQATKEWLFEFWAYLNSTDQVGEHPVNSKNLEMKGLEAFPLLLVTQDGTEMLISLDYFFTNAVVLRTRVDEHKDIYGDFPELGIVNPRTIPSSYRDAEKSLQGVDSINRFLKSVGLLADQKSLSMSEFVKLRLASKNAKALRTILNGLVPTDVTALSDLVKDLPIWPPIASDHGFLTAREALLAQNPAFMVPWMRDYERFADTCGLFGMHAIASDRLLQEYILPHLPERIDDANQDAYVRLVNALPYDASLKRKISKKNKTRIFIIPLSERRLAARLDGKLCLASELFDHDDAIFAASFRLQASNNFLMPVIERHRAFWHEIGLRHRESGRFKGADYLACVLALEDRLKHRPDVHLVTDTEVILNPLRVNDGALEHFSANTWNAITKLKIFPILPVPENTPQYQKHQAEYLASQRNTLSFEIIVLREHAAVCWSQTAFTLYEPSSSSIQKTGLKVHPSCTMVWEHLKFLAKIAGSIKEGEIESFMSDLQKTYEYLHLKQPESMHTFNDKTAVIWWNGEMQDSNLVDKYALHSSWTNLENLILDSPCDAPPLMTVNTFLGRFSSLLKNIGCKSLHYPPVTLSSENGSKNTLDAVRQLREKDILNDVSFEAEGSVISAHKVILASRSIYCQKQFHGPWASRSDSSPNKEPIKLEDMGHSTLKILIEHCYEDHLDWAAGMQVHQNDDVSTVAEKLDALLEVLVAADRWMMPDLHLDAQDQVFRGIRHFVRPDNVKHVEKIAGEANAGKLRLYCEEYCIDNAEAVMLASAEPDERN